MIALKVFFWYAMFMQTNPLAKRIVCFGDSNTWGYIPGSKHQRYPANVRWPGALQDLLGNTWEVIEEGLNSRGILNGDSRPGKEGRNAMEYIRPCLDTHDPIDYIVLLLGTNDLKAELNLSTEQIGADLKSLIEVIKTRPSQCRDITPQIIVVVPPILDETTEYTQTGNKYVGAYKKSKDLPRIYEQITKDTESLFVNIQEQLKTGTDGVHLLSESHTALAQAVLQSITN
jgi:lysophospholipase L1-like esterase